MRRSRNLLRCLRLACALLQFSVPGSVALADAVDDGAPAAAAIPHFESHTTDSCPHAHGFDAFCQFLNAAFGLPAPIVVAFGAGRDLVLPIAVQGVSSPVGGTCHPQSRAPPALS
jgi:hypothetical protein